MGLLPLGRGQNKFAVVAIDYFTKWAEVEALTTITEQRMVNFLWKNIVYHFGIPRVVITDNEKQFEGSSSMSYAPTCRSATTSPPQSTPKQTDK